jgi:hypothetical protein
MRRFLMLVLTLFVFAQLMPAQSAATKAASGNYKIEVKNAGSKPGQTTRPHYELSTVPAITPALPAKPASSKSARSIKPKNSSGKTPQTTFFFSPPVNYPPAGELPFGVAVADLTGSGVNDVINTSWYGGNVGVLLGNGDGTLQGVRNYSAHGSCLTWVVPAALVSTSTNIDLVATGGCNGPAQEGFVSVLIGNGTGSFSSGVTYDSGGGEGPNGPNTNYPAMVAVLDVNGDGIPDIIVANQLGEANGDGSVAVLLGNGNGTFQTAVTYDSAGITANGVAVADVNDDGYPDIVVGNACATSACSGGSVSVFLNNGISNPGTFGAPTTYSLPGPAIGLSLTDVTGDGAPDIIVGNEGYGVQLLINNDDGTGTFQSPQGLGGAGQVVSVAVQDVNGDGIPDIVTGLGYCGGCDNGVDGGVSVALGEGGGSFGQWQTYDSAGVLVFGVAIGDLNGDGMPEIIGSNGCDSGFFDDGCYGSVAVFLNSVNGLSTTLASSVNPVIGKGKVTYTASVSNPNGTVSGTVNFWDNQNILGSPTINSSTSTGTATDKTSYTTAGINNVAAEYLPSSLPTGTYSLSTPVFEQAIGKSTTTVATSGSPSNVFAPVTFTATITSTAGAIPNGELVTFFSGADEIGTANTNGGQAVFTISTLSANSHLIKAAYAGDSNNTSSTGTLTQVVNKLNTTVTVSSNPNPSIQNKRVTLTATVSNGTSYIPTGKVSFYSNGVLVGTPVLTSNGTTSMTTNALAVGTDSITATYEGDLYDATSTSAPYTQTVNP